MGLPLLKPATYEDLYQLPPHQVGEIIHGSLYVHPRPAPRHARACASLDRRLGNPFDDGLDGPGGWWILNEPELHLDHHILVPDLAGWRRERLPSLPTTAWFDLAPDWVCEILSPSTARVDRVDKLPIYASQGVSHIWLVDPDLRTLEAYENHDGRWLLLATLQDDAEVRLPPFDAVGFSLAGLWVD